MVYHPLLLQTVHGADMQLNEPCTLLISSKYTDDIIIHLPYFLLQVTHRGRISTTSHARIHISTTGHVRIRIKYYKSHALRLNVQ